MFRSKNMLFLLFTHSFKKKYSLFVVVLSFAKKKSDHINEGFSFAMNIQM